MAGRQARHAGQLTAMEILVREADDDDIPLIADLTRAAWHGRDMPRSGGHDETADSVAQDMQLGGAFVLLVDDQPAGSVRWVRLETESNVWEILRMGVLPQWRGQQLSQHLLEAVVHHAMASEVNELRLAVPFDQPALLDLYAALGFETAHELEHSHSTPRPDAPPAPPIVVMRRLLRR